MLKKVEIKEIKSLEEAQFIPTQLVIVDVEGKEKQWEMIKGKDTVHVLVDCPDTKELLLVKQVRIPVLVNSGNGEMIECCAGLIDKDLEPIEIAREEILEELGYDVPVENIELVKTLKSSVGISGTTAFTYYCIANSSMKVSEGGGLEDEDIEIVRVSYNDVFSFLQNTDNIDAVTMFLLTDWINIVMINKLEEMTYGRD